MNIIPLMLCKTPEELRHQRMLRQQRELELRELAAFGRKEFTNRQVPGTRPDSGTGSEWNFKRNPWGWE